MIDQLEGSRPYIDKFKVISKTLVENKRLNYREDVN
jgi:hypothetical protein